jgi:membrane protein implicated in regulation of membrane protease activity
MFKHEPHPQLLRRQRGEVRPPKVRDEHVGLNGRIALALTDGVGTMWCAYAFAILALIALPYVHTTLQLIQWISQTFIQLVMLSVIMVGQSVQGRTADKRGEQTYNDAEAVLHECLEIQRHLQEQDKILAGLTANAK